MVTVSGHCYCGAIEFEVDGPEKFACNVLLGEIHWHSSSAGVTRRVCAECGSSMTYENENRPSEIDVSLNCLNEPTVPVLRTHIWAEDKQPWFQIGDDLPVHKKTVE